MRSTGVQQPQPSNDLRRLRPPRKFSGLMPSSRSTSVTVGYVGRNLRVGPRSAGALPGPPATGRRDWPNACRPPRTTMPSGSNPLTGSKSSCLAGRRPCGTGCAVCSVRRALIELPPPFLRIGVVLHGHSRVGLGQLACHSVASRPRMTTSAKFPLTHAESRRVPSRANPARLAA
jgi:hypothetical protein